MSKDMVDGGWGGEGGRNAQAWNFSTVLSQKANRVYTDFRNNYCCCQ